MAGLPKSMIAFLEPVVPFKGNGNNPTRDKELKQQTFILFASVVLGVGTGLSLFYRVEHQRLQERGRTT